ncbi:MAG: sigma 54-interacting transcriptional regulator [Acidobacteriia bacterium]|nr:sigma 54-interacting transcriptional regulator [Terriglobia bacterium]
MQARLMAVSGPLEGSMVELTEDFSIGREKTNALCIDDRVLSRKHCAIGPSNDKFTIRDLHSSNGTYVNGLPVDTRVLHHGDQISIGQSVFVFLENGREPGQPALELDHRAPISESTLMLKAEDALYVRSRQLPQTDRTLRNVEALLQIGSTISSIRGLESLQAKLLHLILEVIPGERGAIFLGGRAGEDFASVYHWTPNPADRPLPVPRSIIERVIREKVGLLSNNVLQDTAVNLTESILRARAGSVLAAPLVGPDKALGAIYVDTRNSGTCFDDDHLQLLTGIAHTAASALETALRFETLQGENRRLKAEININHDMVGDSPRMRQVLDFIGKVASSSSTVLLRGESGTGKELVARAIHRNSPRSSKPCVAINCAALTESLLESELFGHEKGAFTGAVFLKKGKLEEASGGSVFLDELGELASGLQAKLLRVLQEREFERVGGTRAIKTDIRLIAATNRDLEEAVRAGTFRRDLYYRLNVVSVVLPPLRERRGDIPQLANYFVQKHARNATRHVVGISEEAQVYLRNYDWPGNVRELENAMERAIVLGSTELILPEDLPDSIVETEVPEAPGAGGFHEMVRDAKRQIVLRTLEMSEGNYSEAARRLRLHPSNLHRLIRSLKLREELKR